ncbi:hypothetical protein [Streptomyces sp. NRRL F-5650]|uniref:hypothetical protein n=1 Tax=Streptomyces sp. NRRL F-5650 TaxID=1463868 RepID=UPI000689E7C8|nr:hypothetical protein [Streptomyces sp. NRRL F-5650]
MRGAEHGGPAARAGAEADMAVRHGRGRDAGPRPAPGDVPAAEALLAAVLRGEGAGAEGERRAVAAFRAARDAEPGRAARTRRRDDWRPRTGCRPGRSLKTALFVALGSLTLGGVAYAAMGGGAPGAHVGEPDRTRPATAPATAGSSSVGLPSDRGASSDRGPSSGGAPADGLIRPGGTPSAAASPSARETPTPPAYPGRPSPARDAEAHCRAYERVAGRGGALDGTAWQRLVTAAGGAEHVEAYCAGRWTRPVAPASPNAAGVSAPGRNVGGDAAAGRTPGRDQ